jgi:hypothetical protein
LKIEKLKIAILKIEKLKIAILKIEKLKIAILKIEKAEDFSYIQCMHVKDRYVCTCSVVAPRFTVETQVADCQVTERHVEENKVIEQT